MVRGLTDNSESAQIERRPCDSDEGLKRAFLCLHELDRESGECTGVVRFYCSESCRAAARSRSALVYAADASTDAVDDTACDECGKRLI
jgi:hypothetical protein